MKLSFPRIGLTGKPGDDAVHKVLKLIASRLGDRGVEVSAENSVAASLGVAGYEPDALAKRVSLIICVGGDGTLLHAARQYGLKGLPLVGVNLGRLGFLVDVSPEEIDTRLDQILGGNFIQEDRLLIEMTARRAGEVLGQAAALNDVVLHKTDPGRMLEFSTHIDDKGVTTHRADGMVVATPTGSTAYALSGGGPILHPSMDAIVMVPISPHTLSDRPLVVSADSRIVLTVGLGAGGASVSCDGQPGVELRAGDTVEVMRHQLTVKLLHPADYDFFRLLRDKLHWGRAPGPTSD